MEERFTPTQEPKITIPSGKLLIGDPGELCFPRDFQDSLWKIPQNQTIVSYQHGAILNFYAAHGPGPEESVLVYHDEHKDTINLTFARELLGYLEDIMCKESLENIAEEIYKQSAQTSLTGHNNKLFLGDAETYHVTDEDIMSGPDPGMNQMVLNSVKTHRTIIDVPKTPYRVHYNQSQKCFTLKHT